MATEQEKRLKTEHDAWLAQSQAAANQANIDYISMMADIDIPTEDKDAQREI